MKHLPAIAWIFGTVLLGGCREQDEVSLDESRPVSTGDFPPRLDATSDERFSNARRSPVAADTPKDWIVVPATEFRLLNYRFGLSGKGEVWVSDSSGTVLANVNRWLRQFGAAEIDEAALQALPTLPMLGATGVLVKAEGDYAGGMGQPPQPGYGLAGVIAEVDGRIYTVKMVAPAAEVRFGMLALEELVASLRKVD